MKRAISLILALILVLLFTACGNSAVKDVENAIEKIAEASKDDKAAAVKAAEEAYNALTDKQKESVKNNDVLKKSMIFVLASEAYDNVESAYSITEKMGSDIYEAWRVGIYDADDKDFGLGHLADELSLSLSDIRVGFSAWLYELLYDEKWETVSNDKKETCIKQADDTFISFTDYFSDDVFSTCVDIVVRAYIENGQVADAQKHLEQAKAQMKYMSEKYADYEHYPNLKGYYTTTNAFFEFCKDPTGSFEQLKNTVNDYKNDARKYRNELSYIFED